MGSLLIIGKCRLQNRMNIYNLSSNHCFFICSLQIINVYKYIIVYIYVTLCVKVDVVSYCLSFENQCMSTIFTIISAVLICLRTGGHKQCILSLMDTHQWVLPS